MILPTGAITWSNPVTHAFGWYNDSVGKVESLGHAHTASYHCLSTIGSYGHELLKRHFFLHEESFYRVVDVQSSCSPLQWYQRESSSFVEKSANTMWINTISWAVLLLSTDSSYWMLNYRHVFKSLSSCSFKFTDKADILLVTALAPSCDLRSHLAPFNHV